jgi:hypothetical protein
MRHTDVRRAHHHDIDLPAGVTSFSPEALRRVLATTQVTSAAHYLVGDRTLRDYRASIYLYFDRYLTHGDLHDLAKAIMKAVSLREYQQAQDEAGPGEA